MSRMTSLRTSKASILALGALSGAWLASPANAHAHAFDASEASFDATYAATTISLSGLIVDEAGTPVSGAQITAVGWGAAAGNAGATATTGTSGAFVLSSLSRRSILLKVVHASYYSEVLAIDLHRPLAEAAANAGVVVLTRKKAGRARFVFGGDTMFGRRFVDADADGTEGEPGDLIRPATRAADAKALFRFMRDVLSAADYTQINLECPVTANPLTPHPYKEFTFFSYPETLQALPYAGVDAVSLGNNHMYDYLEAGVADTLVAVPGAGLDWFGAGMSEAAAQGTTAYRRLGGGVDVALLGFNQLVYDGTTQSEYALVARDTPGPKGGALEMSTANITDFTAAETADRFTIPVLHGGLEYSDYPTSGMRSRFIQLIQQGAGLIVAHHPHTVHGVALYNPGDGPRYALLSLGNLLFDQDVFETFQSYVAIVDVDQAAPGAHEVHRVQLVPFHAEGYVPKQVSGGWLERAGRHVGHLSTTLPTSASGGTADGLTGATVFPAGSRIVAASDPSQYLMSQSVEALTAPVASLSTGAIEFARTGPSDTLGGIKTSAPMKCEVGREIGIYGDFEDGDVDDVFHEGAMWPQSAYRYVQNSVVHSGIGAAVLLRSKSSTTYTSLYMDNRVRFTPANKLTLRGFIKGSNAGQLRIQVYWYTGGGGDISNSYVYTRAAGTYDWQTFSINLTPPSGAESVRVYYRAYAPLTGEAATFLDDIALIQWEKSTADASAGFPLATPNEWSFLRCTTTDAGLSSVDLTLTHRAYHLATATP